MRRRSDRLTCAAVRARIEGWVDGEMEGSTALEHHLESCPRCRAEADGARCVRDLLREAPRIEPGPEVVELARRRIALERAEIRRRRTAWIGWAAAAVVMLGLGLGALWRSRDVAVSEVEIRASTAEARFALAVVAHAGSVARAELARSLEPAGEAGDRLRALGGALGLGSNQTPPAEGSDGERRGGGA